MSYDTVSYEKKGRVAYIKLNRPKSLNAFNDSLYKDLEAAFSEFDMDDEVWVCIVHGAGRCFSAGGDVKGQFFNQIEKRKYKEALHILMKVSFSPQLIGNL